MKISQSRPVVEEFILTEETVKEVTKKYLRSFLNGGEYLRKEKGKIYLKQDDPEWRHGSVSEETVREATELDLAIFKVLDAIKK